MRRPPKYFVAQMNDQSHRPWPSAKYHVQVLDRQGRGALVHYFDGDGVYLGCEDAWSNVVVAEIQKAPLPFAVIDAMLKQPFGKGDYVGADGAIVALF